MALRVTVFITFLLGKKQSSAIIYTWGYVNSQLNDPIHMIPSAGEETRSWRRWIQRFLNPIHLCPLFIRGLQGSKLGKFTYFHFPGNFIRKITTDLLDKSCQWQKLCNLVNHNSTTSKKQCSICNWAYQITSISLLSWNCLNVNITIYLWSEENVIRERKKKKARL